MADVDRPELGSGEVLIRSRAVGICHSDFELLEGRYIIPFSYPVIPGHEWSGEVVEVGPRTAEFAPGERVVGECSIAADEHFGFTIDGAAAEYFKARAEWLHRLPDRLSFTQGALVEPFTVAYNGVRTAGGIDASDNVVIFGGGPIGQCCVAAARASGGYTILVEPVAERRAVATSLGADATIDPRAGDVEAQVRELTGGRGADVVLEASGSPAATAAALEVAEQDARLSHIGINVGAEGSAKLGLIQSKALSMRGIIGSPDIWPAALRFLVRTGIDLSPIVSTTFPLTRALDALEAARDTRSNIKVHIIVNE